MPYLHPPHTTVHTLVSGTPPFHHHQKYAGSPPVHCGVKKAATNFLKRYKPFPSNPGCENVFTDQSPLRKFKPSVAKEFEFRLPRRDGHTPLLPTLHLPPPFTMPKADKSGKDEATDPQSPVRSLPPPRHNRRGNTSAHTPPPLPLPPPCVPPPLQCPDYLRALHACTRAEHPPARQQPAVCGCGMHVLTAFGLSSLAYPLPPPLPYFLQCPFL